MEGTIFYKIGDGLNRLGRTIEADTLYEEAVHAGLFPGFFQRSAITATEITSRPFWNLKQTGIPNLLKGIINEWNSIRKEALDILSRNMFIKHSEDISDKRN